MSRIDRYLDGELERAALTPEEAAAADSLALTIQAARAYVSARPAPDLTDGIMCRIDEQGMHPTARDRRTMLARWAAGFWAPRPVSFQFRPAYAMLLACAVVALPNVWPVFRGAPASVSMQAEAVEEPRILVQFRLEAVSASDVRLAGSFSDWSPRYQLHQDMRGVWTLTLPLPAGVHDYAFVIDGDRWVSDPYAPSVDDGFGGLNSRLALVHANGQQL